MSLKRLTGAVYLSGIALEIMLKVRVCIDNSWSHFPESDAEFKPHAIDLKIHDLNKLLGYTDLKAMVRSKLQVEWTIVRQWKPDLRYRREGEMSIADARAAVHSARRIVGNL